MKISNLLHVAIVSNKYKMGYFILFKTFNTISYIITNDSMGKKKNQVVRYIEILIFIFAFIIREISKKLNFSYVATLLIILLYIG